MDPLKNLSPPAVIGEAIAGRAYFVRKQLAELAGDIQARTFDLAELLAEAKQGSLYIPWGFSSVGEYAAAELGLKARKAQYLCRIVEVCNAVGVKRTDYEGIGVSKLREITSLEPTGTFWNKETKENEDLSEHIVRLITDADEMTVEQVAEEVLRLKDRVGENRPVVRSFSVPEAVWETVIKPAQELARQRLGSAKRDSEGNAVEYSEGAVEEIIHREFLNDPNNYPEPEVTGVEGEDIPQEEPQV